MAVRAVSVTGGVDLFGAPPAARSERARTISIAIQIDALADGTAAVTLRLRRNELVALFGAVPDADLAHVARNLAFAVRFSNRGATLSVSGYANRIGPTIARAAGPEEWILGPIPLPAAAAPAPLDQHLRLGLLPLTWRGLGARLKRRALDIPDLASVPAEVGGAPLAPPVRTPVVRAARTTEAAEPRSPGAPPENGGPARAIRPAADGTRRARVRVCPGTHGRVGLTLTDAAMADLWAGRPAAAERPCRMVRSGTDLVVLPSDDPAGMASEGPTLVLRPATGGRWYGRTPRAASLPLQLRPRPVADGDGMVSEAQPGRVVLRGAFPAPRPHPAAFRLARAKRMLSEALALVAAARHEGIAEIEILDAAGGSLLVVPPEAAAARIRIAATAPGSAGAA